MLYFIKDYFVLLYPTKSYYWKVPIFNNISKQNWFDKPVLNNVKRLNHCSPMKNTVTHKIKHSPELFALGPQISISVFPISETQLSTSS